jgi:hypothetical protein
MDEVKIRGQWVKDIAKALEPYGDYLDTVVFPMLDKVDVLLQIASADTDNEFLHDDILELLTKGFTK